MLDLVDMGFLVNRANRLILVDAGGRQLVGWVSTPGVWWGSLRSAAYTPEEVDLVLVTHLHSDHVAPHDAGRKRSFSQCGCFTSPRPKAPFGYRRNPRWLRRRRCCSRSSRVRSHTAAPYINAGKWNTFQWPPTNRRRIVNRPAACHTPGQTGMNFRVQGTTNSVWGATLHSTSIHCSIPRSQRFFDIDHTAAGRRGIIADKLAPRGVC